LLAQTKEYACKIRAEPLKLDIFLTVIFAMINSQKLFCRKLTSLSLSDLLAQTCTFFWGGQKLNFLGGGAKIGFFGQKSDIFMAKICHFIGQK
jgi:hypothetical protein